MGKLNSYHYEFGNSVTDLCKIGMITQADKSPYCTGKWRHSYTPLYDMLFSKMRYDNINIGEMGIYKGGSIEMWSQYFPNANVYGWDHSDEFVNYVSGLNLDRVKIAKCNQADEQDLNRALGEPGVKYDILIEDGSHLAWDQIKFMRNAWRYLKPGGIMVIEDIGTHPEEFYQYNTKEELEDLLRDHLYMYNHMCYYSSISFVEVNHENKFVDPFDNDKVLILVRNNIE